MLSKCVLILVIAILSGLDCFLLNASHVIPGKEWNWHTPSEANINEEQISKLALLIGGNGCVVKGGYMVYGWGNLKKSEDVASAFKPVLTTLLFIALQNGLIGSIHEPIVKYQPELAELNGGKDAKITWYHLANQISGYGLKEFPGQAYSYNDYALALYYDTLMDKVFKNDGSEVLKRYLADSLGFEDSYTFDAFGKNSRRGRLAVSPRDFARFGLLILNKGKWGDKQIIKEEYVELMLNFPLSANFPLTSGEFAEMIANQRSIGGTRNITSIGPGYYSFNWWLNKTNVHGKKLLHDAPFDTVIASGHGGKRCLIIIPSLDLIACWNDTKIEDQDVSPFKSDTLMNRAVALLVSSVSSFGVLSSSEIKSSTILGVDKTTFTINGKPTFLLGMSYYGALGADESILTIDLNLMTKCGFNWIRVWATWTAFDNDVSAVDSISGKLREPYMSKLRWLVDECDKRGMVVDVTISRGNGIAGNAMLSDIESHKEAVKSLITALRPYRNWYLDLSNERNVKDKRFTSMEDLKKLRQFARELYPELLVTASHAGDISKEELLQYLIIAGLDFISPHRPRDRSSVKRTEIQTKMYLEMMKGIGWAWVKPVHYQEPFRRDFAQWEPELEDFIMDLQGAQNGGAGGWCFHNGDNRTNLDGKPRRCFDLRMGSVFAQLDDVESKFVKWVERN